MRQGRAQGVLSDVTRPNPVGVTIRWRTLECWTLGLALFLQTGAVIQVYLETSGSFAGATQAILQLLNLPIYLAALVQIARHPVGFGLVLRRNMLLAALICLPLLSVLWSISPSITLRRALALLLSSLLAYVLAMRFSPRQLLVLIGAVLGACMVLSLAAIVVAPNLAFMPWTNEVRGVFIHKNVLGWYAAIAILVTGALAADRTLGLRLIALPLLAASVMCLLLSQSGTALVTAIAAGLVALFYKIFLRLRVLGRILLIVLALQVTVLLVAFVDVILLPILEGTGKEVSLTGRVPLWALIDQAIARKPLLGYGYQAFWTDGNVTAWDVWTKLAWRAPHAHNGYRDSLLHFGFLGTVILLMVLLRALRDGAVVLCRFPKEAWLWLNTLVVIFLIMNLTESLVLVQNYFLFTLVETAILMFSLRAADDPRPDA